MHFDIGHFGSQCVRRKLLCVGSFIQLIVRENLLKAQKDYKANKKSDFVNNY